MVIKNSVLLLYLWKWISSVAHKGTDVLSVILNVLCGQPDSFQTGPGFLTAEVAKKALWDHLVQCACLPAAPCVECSLIVVHGVNILSS